MTTTTRVCTQCLEEKAIKEFNFSHKQRGKRESRCRSCHTKASRKCWLANKQHYQQKLSEYRAQRREEQRILLRQYLESHPCIDCGEADPCCLEFDHVRGKKRDVVPRMIGNYSWESILNEISKCEVRCANCHRKRHAKRRSLAVFTPL
jgi:hypothetical protein